jgi:hypothetical protein
LWSFERAQAKASSEPLLALRERPAISFIPVAQPQNEVRMLHPLAHEIRVIGELLA